MATENAANSGQCGMYNNNLLSDVTVKFSGQKVVAHKAILALKSEYFRRAFAGKFLVATSDEVNLGDDDEVEAVYTMIRYMYDFRYDEDFGEEMESDTHPFLDTSSLNAHLDVFIVADKYDVPSLRHKVVPKFAGLMEISWNTEDFVASMQRLCGPDAVQLADNSLQAVAAEFFANNISKVRQHAALVRMIQEDKSFAGRVLAGLLNPSLSSARQFHTCYKPFRSNNTRPDCSGLTEGSPGFLQALDAICVHCGTSPGGEYRRTGGAVALVQLKQYKKAVIL